ncbi:MAG: methyltransferase domain-containing protein [Halobacteriovoraceae bacterium]|nr:methyltransferase domain-containing protein [Halobacteriovoraceae bacterium]
MHDYILSEQMDEIERLKSQSDIWSEETRAFWKQAKIKVGMKGVDMGCGPGFACVELAEIVGESGSMTAFDGSENYLAYLKSQIKERQIKNIEVKRGDILETNLPDNHFDFIFTRMVLIYIPRLEKALEEFKRILKPKGMLLISDFYDYDQFNLNVDAPLFKKLVNLITRDFAERKADVKVGKRITRLLRESDFNVENMQAASKIAYSDDVAWQWPEGFFKIYIPDLLQRNKISSEQVDAFWREWKKLVSDKSVCFLGPALLQIIARK